MKQTSNSRWFKETLRQDLKFVQLAAILLWPLGIVAMWEWYYRWLDEFFLPQTVAAAVGLITAPLIPLAVVAETAWHGWTDELWWGFLSLCCFLLILGTGWLLHRIG